MFSDLDVYQSHEQGYLREIGQETKPNYSAASGNRRICPTAAKFNEKHGSAERTPPPIDPGSQGGRFLRGRCHEVPAGIGWAKRESSFRVESTVKALKKYARKPTHSGVKIAVENHAGDLHTVVNW